jgi:hypothetical protein
MKISEFEVDADDDNEEAEEVEEEVEGEDGIKSVSESDYQPSKGKERIFGKRPGASSKYRGVTWLAAKNKWKVQLSFDGKTKYVFYSNIYNIDDASYNKIINEYEVIKNFKNRGVYISIYKRKITK